MSPAASTSRLAALPAAGPDDGGSPRSQYSSELEIDDPREGSQLLRTISHTSSIAGSVLSRITSDIFDSPQDRWDGPSPGGSRDKLKRRLMLGCACSLSLGSHYGSHLIGPLKHRLGEKETTFSSLIGAFELINTLTPLVSGLLVPRFGAAAVGLVATGVVVVGLGIVVVSGLDNVLPTVLGLFIFGFGLAPLSVVQESIIIAHNSSDKPGLTGKSSVGRVLAAGLLLGKSAAFAGALTSEPLAQISLALPFIAALALAFLSFCIAVLYSRLEKSLPPTVVDPLSEDLHGRRKLMMPSEISTFGDPFFLYLLVCLLVGVWYTFIHLSASLVATLYDVTPTVASQIAAMIPLGALIMYPIVGTVVDSRPEILSRLFYVVPSLFSLSCGMLVIAPAVPMALAVLPGAIALGSGPLLMVIVVPRLVRSDQIAPALGIHKMMENAGGVLFQSTMAWVSTGGSKVENARLVVKVLGTMGLLQLGTVVVWWRVNDARTAKREGGYHLVGAVEGEHKLREQTRGYIGLGVGSFLILCSWIVFAWNLSKQ